MTLSYETITSLVDAKEVLTPDFINRLNNQKVILVCHYPGNTCLFFGEKFIINASQLKKKNDKVLINGSYYSLKRFKLLKIPKQITSLKDWLKKNNL